MKEVLRFDRHLPLGSLRKATITAQGFLRADGYAARVGIYPYRRNDGSITYELRPEDEVFHQDSLDSYDGAPITVEHPDEEEVTAENVKRLEVGTVSGPGRRDGDFVATTNFVKAARAVKLVRDGKQELSPGHRILLDETSGTDARYATPDNPTGRYDAVQRRIRVNHLAIVDRARGGSNVRLRIDDAESVLRSSSGAIRRDSNGRLTTIAMGHQHLLDTDPPSYYGSPGPLSGTQNSGCTSWAVSAGAEGGHSHDWVRGPDGKITIAMSEGHTHDLIPDDAGQYGALGSANVDQSPTRGDSSRMTAPIKTPDPAEQIRLLTVRADDAERAAAERRDALEAATREREGLRAELTTVREQVTTLQARLDAGAAAVETAAVIEQRRRADAAEQELATLRNSQPSLIRARATLIARAQAVLGPDARADALTSMSDRDILGNAIRRMRPNDNIGPDVSEDYLRRRFDSLVDERTTFATSMARASETIATRVDTTPAAPGRSPEVSWQDQWKRGAGQFATRKDG